MSSIALTSYGYQNIRARQQRTFKGCSLIISAHIPKLVGSTCVNINDLFLLLHKIRKTIKIEHKTTRPSDFHFIFKTKIWKFQLLLQPSYKIINSLTWKLEKDNIGCCVNKRNWNILPWQLEKRFLESGVKIFIICSCQFLLFSHHRESDSKSFSNKKAFLGQTRREELLISKV